MVWYGLVWFGQNFEAACRFREVICWFREVSVGDPGCYLLVLGGYLGGWINQVGG